MRDDVWICAHVYLRTTDRNTTSKYHLKTSSKRGQNQGGFGWYFEAVVEWGHNSTTTSKYHLKIPPKSSWQNEPQAMVMGDQVALQVSTCRWKFDWKYHFYIQEDTFLPVASPSRLLLTYKRPDGGFFGKRSRRLTSGVAREKDLRWVHSGLRVPYG